MGRRCVEPAIPQCTPLVAGSPCRLGAVRLSRMCRGSSSRDLAASLLSASEPRKVESSEGVECWECCQKSLLRCFDGFLIKRDGFNDESKFIYFKY